MPANAAGCVDDSDSDESSEDDEEWED